jgi:hypothetical protein
MDKVILELTRITQQVGLVDSPAGQVRLIVDSISEVIGVDVCSLYRASAHGMFVDLVVSIFYPVTREPLL